MTIRNEAQKSVPYGCDLPQKAGKERKRILIEKQKMLFPATIFRMMEIDLSWQFCTKLYYYMLKPN